MTNHVLLNSIDHKDLKIRTERSAEFGDNLWYAQTFLREFGSAQAHYPILFHKDANTGQFFPVTLFGFCNEENLFLENGNWDASYIPVSVQRLPFLIGFQNDAMGGTSEKKRVVTVDMDSPKVSTSEGIPLFLEYGGNTEYLESIANMLESLHLGLQENDDFIQTLCRCELLESVTLDIELNDGSQNQMLGFYTINEDVLHALDDDNILSLYKNGYLQAIYMVLASQARIRDLIARKNKLITA